MFAKTWEVLLYLIAVFPLDQTLQVFLQRLWCSGLEVASASSLDGEICGFINSAVRLRCHTLHLVIVYRGQISP